MPRYHRDPNAQWRGRCTPEELEEVAELEAKLAVLDQQRADVRVQIDAICKLASQRGRFARAIAAQKPWALRCNANTHRRDKRAATA